MDDEFQMGGFRGWLILPDNQHMPKSQFSVHNMNRPAYSEKKVNVIKHKLFLWIYDKQINALIIKVTNLSGNYKCGLINIYKYLHKK